VDNPAAHGFLFGFSKSTHHGYSIPLAGLNITTCHHQNLLFDAVKLFITTDPIA
jgi:hypothetical protein